MGDEGLRMAEPVAHPGSLMSASWGIGLLCLRQGDLPRALPRLERAVGICQEVDLPAYFPRMAAALGAAYALAGRLEEAQALAEHTLALAHHHQECGHQAYALHLLGETAVRREPPEVEAAEDDYRQALALAEELGMRPLLAHCHRGLGALYGKVGRQDQARAELSTAVALYRSMEMTFWLPQAEAAESEVEGH